MTTNLSGYNFAYLDEQTKRMIRRAILKAVAIPGYQVPFGGREMPMPYGWGTGGIQLTASVIGEPDVLKVIDQGADDTTNAVSIRPPPHSGNAANRRSDNHLPGADPRAAALYRTARNGNPHHARAGRVRHHAGETV